MLNRWVLSRDRKTAMEGAEVTRSGRLSQTRAAATGKARSPTVDSRVRLAISDEDELERSSSSSEFISCVEEGHVKTLFIQ